MATAQEIETAKHGILALLAMRAEHTDSYNGVVDLGKGALKSLLGRPEISVPNPDVKDATMMAPNPYKSTQEATATAFDALSAEGFVQPDETRKSNFVITEKGKQELKKMQAGEQPGAVKKVAHR